MLGNRIILLPRYRVNLGWGVTQLVCKCWNHLERFFRWPSNFIRCSFTSTPSFWVTYVQSMLNLNIIYYSFRRDQMATINANLLFSTLFNNKTLCLHVTRKCNIQRAWVLMIKPSNYPRTVSIVSDRTSTKWPFTTIKKAT